MKRIFSILLVLSVAFVVLTLGSSTAAASENPDPIMLKIDGFKARTVVSYNYGVERSVDVEGQPSSLPKGTPIVVRVKSLYGKNNELFSWAVDPYDPKNAQIEFTDTVNGKNIKSINLKDVYCSKYTEYWDDSGEYYEELTLIPGEFQSGPASYKRLWN